MFTEEDPVEHSELGLAHSKCQAQLTLMTITAPRVPVLVAGGQRLADDIPVLGSWPPLFAK